MKLIRSRLFLPLFLAVGLIVPPAAVLLVSATRWPLGPAGQWQWLRIAGFSPDQPLKLGFALGLFLAAAIFAVALDRTAQGGRSPKMLIGCLVPILFCGFVADRLILECGRAGNNENLVAILDRFATGYLGEAEQVRPGELARRARTILNVPAGEVPLHLQVHPPGNFLLAKAAGLLPPAFGTALFRVHDEEIDELLKAEILLPPLDNERAIRIGWNLLALLFGALTLGKILLAAAVLTVGLRRPGLAVLLIAFGSGAGILFCGHYDTFYFGITAAGTALAILLETAERPGRRRLAAAGLGLTLGLGATFSLGFGAPLLGAGLLILRRREDRIARLACFAGGGLLVLGSFALAGINLPDCALQCWENHRSFNLAAGRSWWPWAAFNALDALLFAGALPAAGGLAALGLSRRHPAFPAFGIAGAIWLFLLFSGSAKGEFGRLLILYLPVLLAMAALYLGRFARLTDAGCRIALGAVALGWLQTVWLRETLKLVLIDFD